MIKSGSQHDKNRGIAFIGVTVVFFCHDGKGKLLLHKRSKKNRDEHGRWDPGGGSMEFGESFEEAVRREVKEEYCAEILKLDFITVNNVVRNHKGRKTHWIAIVFAAKVDPKEAKIGEPEKMDNIGWFAPDKLPKPLHSKMDEFLKLVIEANVL